ncbi:MAG: ferritin family protein [Chloroflexi bacterium]|nr:ferritin family protein [Chloroflexota bacterium]
MIVKVLDPLEVLEIAEDGERRGRAFYKGIVGAVPDRSVRSTLLALADDEARHLKDLKEIRKAFSRASRRPHGPIEGRAAQRYKSLVSPQALLDTLPEGDRLTELHALDVGIQLEREFVDLYGDAADGDEDPAASDAFRRLMMEEKMHLSLLTRRFVILKLRS